MSTDLQVIAIENIRLDGGTQPPDRLDLNAVKEYAELMEAGIEFPHPVVFYDGEYAWLAHGFHRLEAMKKNGKADATFEVHQGTLADARDFAHAANRAHGVRLTRAQKRWLVEQAIALDGEMGRERSDREIASHCGASHTLVSTIRKEAVKAAKQAAKSGAGGGSGGGGGNLASDGDSQDDKQPDQPDDGILRDKRGVAVPEKFREVFTVGVAAFDGAMKAAVTRSKELTAWTQSPLGAFLRAQQIKTDCKAEFEHLKFAAPWCICPDCNGDGCGTCANNGWLSRGRFDAWNKTASAAAVA